MRCEKCGFENETNANFCVQCGSDMEIKKSNSSDKVKIIIKRLLIFCAVLISTFLLLFSILIIAVGLSESETALAVIGGILFVVSLIILILAGKENAKYLNKKTTLKPSIIHNKSSVYNENRNDVKADGNSNAKYVLKGANGQLYVYENKVEITRKGVWARANQGLKGTKTIPISSIKSIQVKKSGFVQGYIQFGISGSVENQGGYQAANYDENTITFLDTSSNQIALNIKAYIEDKIVNKANSQSTVIQPSYSGADELKKYKELLDDGIITQDEFDAKKKQLLRL